MSGERILVVDDEPQFLRALQTNLRGAGYDVATATTAQEALAAAGLQPPEAIILDLLLPDGRGTDVCRELRGWTQAPIILVSAVGEEAEKVAALDAGADDYVTKPFAIGELLARLRAVLRRVEPASSRCSRSATDRRPREALGHHARRARRLLPMSSSCSACWQERRQAAHPHDHPARGLGPRLPAGVELHPRLRVAAETQARAGSFAAEVHPHRGRRRLPPRQSEALERANSKTA